MTLEEARAVAEQCGWTLSDAELQKLAAGGSRARRLAELTRKYVTPTAEPAGVFRAQPEEG